MKYYIYIYFDPTRDNEPFYVGKGNGNRALTHLYRKDNHPVTNRIKHIRNLNSEPVVEVLECESEDDAFSLERDLVTTIGRRGTNTGSLLNLTDGGEGTSGYVWTDEAKVTLRLAMIGRSLTEEHKQNIRNSNLGLKRSEETKQKMRKPKSEEHRQKLSEVQAGSVRGPLSEETKAKISESNRGQKRSEETKANLSKALKGNQKLIDSQKGKIVSEETRAKISASLSGRKGRVTSEETKQKMREAHKRRMELKNSI